MKKRGRKKVFDKIVRVRLKQNDYEQVLAALGNTYYRSLAEYLRKLILGQPVTILYRNRSYDEFTEAYIRFKKDLERILSTGSLSDAQKTWLFNEVKSLKEVVVNIYEYVSKNGACQGCSDGIEL